MVSAPVATSHDVSFGCDRRAERIANMALASIMGAELALGRRIVPSRPVVPVVRQWFSPTVGTTEIPTVDTGRVHSFSTEWFPCSWIYWDICPSNGCQHAPSIGSRALEGGIAMDGTDTEKIESRMMCSEDDGKGILQSSVSIRYW